MRTLDEHIAEARRKHLIETLHARYDEVWEVLQDEYKALMDTVTESKAQAGLHYHHTRRLEKQLATIRQNILKLEGA